MSDLNAYDFEHEYYSDEDGEEPDYDYPPQTKDLEVDAEEDVGALADALTLNTKLKEIMSSGLDPVTMQEELNKLMAGMQQMEVSPQEQSRQKAVHNPPPLANITQSSMNQQRGYGQQQSGNKVAKKMAAPADKTRRPQKGVNAGKTFSEHEAMQQAKNNQRLLSKMIKIQTSKSDTIGGYSTSVTRGSAVTNLTSSHGLNRKKMGKKISNDNQKFLQRLQNVKSTMNTKKMREDADRQARIGALRRQVVNTKKSGSNNVWGKSADRARQNKFRAKPTLTLPAWES
ncbi:hypothetical protein TL16_g10011 [Triparma laevis f. inornata]|uniref:Uncharacterized protein n=1 Tax=Triparma laevis f. inornata TaxID=1714386 RepID=A0A9W7BB52_9STRA|nr:hypothetical protein TL16_g10011 [Triparma laevis f. inornata]